MAVGDAAVTQSVRESPAQALQLPKLDLHIHLDLAASFAAVAALSPQTTYAEYRRDFIGPGRFPGLADFLARTHRYLALMQDERGLRIVVEDLFEQLVRDGVIYAEIRFAPLQHVQRSLRDAQVVQIVERAMDEAIAATGVQARLLLCTLRHFSAQDSLRTAELVDGFRGSLVTGLDLAGDEAGYPLQPHEAAFRWAAERGIHLTAHAGEGAGAASVEQTISRLSPERIGHGVRAAEDPAVVRLLVKRGIHLEVCPSSNIQTNVCSDYLSHPVGALRDAGVAVSIGTDCRALSDICLAREYERLRAAFGWTDADFQACNQAGLRAAFVEDDVRRRLMDRIARSVPSGALVDGPAGPLGGPEPSTEVAARRSFGRSLQTVSGRWIDPLDPLPDSFDIRDIAQALANQCRFGGHSRAFYSVAQHSVLMADLATSAGASARMALAALLHDAAEAYLVDLPHPLKHRSELGPPFRRAEAQLETALRQRFDLPVLDPEIKRLDRRLLATERQHFTTATGEWIELQGYDPLELQIEPWPPVRAREEFLARYVQLDSACGRSA